MYDDRLPRGSNPPLQALRLIGRFFGALTITSLRLVAIIGEVSPVFGLFLFLCGIVILIFAGFFLQENWRPVVLVLGGLVAAAVVASAWHIRWVRWASAVAGAVLLVWGGVKGVEAIRRQRVEAWLDRERAASTAIFDEAARRAGLTARDKYEANADLHGWREQFVRLPTAKRQAFGRELLAVSAPHFEAIRAGTGSDRLALDLCNAVLLLDFKDVDLTRYGVNFPLWGMNLSGYPHVPIHYGQIPIRHFTEIDTALAAEIGRAPHAGLLRDCARRLGHPVPP